MAFSDWNQLTSVTRELVIPKVEDNVVLDHALLNRLLDKGTRKTGGSKITFPIRYRFNTQGGSYSGLEVLDSAQEQTRVRGELNWKKYHQPIALSNDELAENGSGVEQVVDLATQETNEAMVDIMDKLATDLQLSGTKNANKAIDGLLAAVDDSSNVDSYAGILRSTYTWWKSSYTASIGSLQLSDLSTMADAVSSGNDEPTLHYMTKAVKTYYEALLQAQVRFAGPHLTLDGSSKKLQYRETDLLSDEYCASGKWWMLNEKYLRIFTLKHPKYPTDKRGFAMSPFVVPTSQDGQLAYILIYMNLVNTQCRRSGALVGITA